MGFHKRTEGLIRWRYKTMELFFFFLCDGSWGLLGAGGGLEGRQLLRRDSLLSAEKLLNAFTVRFDCHLSDFFFFVLLSRE